MPSTSFVYKAFGLRIHSDVQLVTLPELADDGTCPPQVTVHRLDVIPDFADGPLDSSWYQVNEQRFDMYVSQTARFRIQNGDTILVSPCENTPPEHLFLFIMGTCMGMLLYQRGHLLMHGSCVCRDNHALLITGESGAGKSTLAATFVNHGWKLCTDDIAAVSVMADHVMIQSSYPSQKLWQDGINHFDIDEHQRHPIWQKQRREKFTVTRPDSFADGTVQLTAMVFLEAIAGDEPSVTPVTGFATVGQWTNNMYRRNMLTPSQKQACFQHCVNAARLVPMYHVQRTADWQCLEWLYHRLTDEQP